MEYTVVVRSAVVDQTKAEIVFHGTPEELEAVRGFWGDTVKVAGLPNMYAMAVVCGDDCVVVRLTAKSLFVALEAVRRICEPVDRECWRRRSETSSTSAS